MDDMDDMDDMEHLEDTLAEFVLEELGDSEMESTRRHVAQCLECQTRVAGFQHVRRRLEQLPEVDVPRRMVFVGEQTASATRWLPLRWAGAVAVAAALVMAVLLLAPPRFERNDTGFVVAFGSATEVSQSAEISREIERVRAELQYLTELQRVAQRENYLNASAIQLLAQRTERQ